MLLKSAAETQRRYSFLGKKQFLFTTEFFIWLLLYNLKKGRLLSRFLVWAEPELRG